MTFTSESLTSESLMTLAESFVDASDEEVNETITEVISLGREFPAEFTSAMRGLPIVRFCPQFWFYIAIGEDASNWQRFIVDEVNRLLDAMDEIDFGSELLATLNAFGTARDDAVRKAVTQTLVARSHSPSAKVRRAVADLLAEFAEPDDRDATRVLEAYVSDPDWRVRVFAQQAINDVDNRPMHAGLSLADRLRVRFLDLYNWQ